MTYRITASPIKGQNVTTTVEGVLALRHKLAEYRSLGYDITRITRVSKATIIKSFNLSLTIN